MIKQFSVALASCAMLLSTYLSAIIIETAHFREIRQYITPKTVIILDVDDTLLIPAQTLGTDIWFQYRLQEYKKTGMSHQDALERALADWESIRHVTKIKIVEEGTEEIIQQLQKENYVVMGLTTQGLSLATRTIQQLLSLQIDLTRTAPSEKDHYFMNGLGVLYRQGLLFTSGTPKGKALLQLFDLMNFHPKHVLFINDKSSHLKDVQDAVEAKGITFTGLRYSHGDERVAQFSNKIADVQWSQSTFGNILSDEEAVSFLPEQ